MVICENSYRKIIPVAGGKGGVGKSVLSANLGIFLGNSGRRTVLVDLDMGGSNLHTCLGLKNNRPGLGNFVSARGISFKDIMYRTDYPNLFFVPGDALVPGMADMVYGQRRSIVSQLLKLETDYIILDLGSGSHSNIIDYFLISNSGILVATPQATSVLNVFGFLKSLVFRFLQRALSGRKSVGNYVNSLLRETKPNALPPMKKILREIEALDRTAGGTAREYLKNLKPSLVVNMAESPEDLAIIGNLRSLVKKSLEIELSCLGLVYYDKAVGRSVSSLSPLAMQSPESLAARQIARIAEKIIQSRNFPELPLDLSMYRDSFELAALEAESDFPEKDGRTAGGDGGGGLNPEEMIAVMAAQQKKISELQGALRMLNMGGRGGILGGLGGMPD